MANKLLTSPKGVAIWPRLNEPDTKFDEAGVYEVRLAFEPDTPGLDEFVEKLEAVRDEKLEEQKEALIKAGKKGLVSKLTANDVTAPEEDDETGEETGRVIVKFKMKASGVSKKTGRPWTRRPDLFNAKGVKLRKPPKVGGGSILKVSFNPVGYYIAKDKLVGVTCYMEAVQVIELVEFGQKDAGGYGFGEEEGYDGVPEDDEIDSGSYSAADGDEEDDGL